MTLPPPKFREIVDELTKSGSLPPDAQISSVEDLKQARISEEELARALARVARLEYIDLDRNPPDPKLAREIPPTFLNQGNWVPHSIRGGVLTVVTADPFHRQGIVALRSVVHRPMRFAVGAPSKVRSAALRLLEKTYAHTDLEIEPVEQKPEPPKEEKIPKGAALGLNRILEEAITLRATDIHIERLSPEQGRIRFRIDGKLHEIDKRDASELQQILTVIKVRSGLDTSQRPKPQDASFKYQSTTQKLVFDVRVSIVPAVDGEEAVLRLLPGSTSIPDLDGLGLAPEVANKLKELSRVPHGIFLVTGPTGSGKTTTLFALLKEIIRQKQPKVLAVEDPVEYRLQGVTQVQVNPKAGLDFATALRAFLRQDPDVILVGEIRDSETAKVAVEAAMTGHLVLGTLHTNSAALSIRRLAEMGVEPYRIVDTLRGVLAQRLVPKLCPRCSLPDPNAKEVLEHQYKVTEAEPRRRNPKGCNYCHGLGYRGRVPITEFLWVGPAVRDAIARKRSLTEIEKIARRESGFRKLREDAIRRVAEGVISLADALEVTHDV